MNAPTRRRFLTKAAAAAGIAAAAGLLPGDVHRRLADAPARSGRLSDVKHVVLLMQENRSFDHYFGTLPGVAGFGDPHAITLGTGRSVFHQPDPQRPDGYLLPFHLDSRTTAAQRIPSTAHDWRAQHAAWNGGLMDNWLPAHRLADAAAAPYVMGYYLREDIPFHHALADAFTICDRYHCSVLGPTWPNRLYWMTGQLDADGRAGGPVTAKPTPHGPQRWTTYPERLEAAGVSWQVYRETDEYGLNVLAEFARFQDAPVGSPLQRRGMRTLPHGQFEFDAIHDRLPTVSWIIPPARESEHPHFLPAAGAAFIASKIGAIAANPDVWAKTVFILSYDENDGLFDHVPPPVAPPGTPEEYVGGEPIGAGFRVPCIVVSPWTAGGYVASTLLDHTSTLRFLELVTGVREPNISAWRRQTFGDLTTVLRLSSNARAPVLPDTSGPLTLAQFTAERLPLPAQPGVRQSPPRQQSGRRPRIP